VTQPVAAALVGRRVVVGARDDLGGVRAGADPARHQQVREFAVAHGVQGFLAASVGANPRLGLAVLQHEHAEVHEQFHGLGQRLAVLAALEVQRDAFLAREFADGARQQRDGGLRRALLQCGEGEREQGVVAGGEWAPAVLGYLLARGRDNARRPGRVDADRQFAQPGVVSAQNQLVAEQVGEAPAQLAEVAAHERELVTVGAQQRPGQQPAEGGDALSFELRLVLGDVVARAQTPRTSSS